MRPFSRNNKGQAYAELQRRKALLSDRMDQEMKEIRQTLRIVREAYRPENLVRQGIRSMLGLKNKRDAAGRENSAPFRNMLLRALPWALIGKWLSKDARLAGIIGVIGPVLSSYAPEIFSEENPSNRAFLKLKEQLNQWLGKQGVESNTPQP
jgi:hypothetical protein